MQNDGIVFDIHRGDMAAYRTLDCNFTAGFTLKQPFSAYRTIDKYRHVFTSLYTYRAYHVIVDNSMSTLR